MPEAAAVRALQGLGVGPAGAADLTEADEAHLDRQMLRHLLREAGRSIAGAIAATTAVAGLVLCSPGERVEPYWTRTLTWWALLLSSQLAVFALAHWFRRAGHLDQALARMHRALLGAQALTGWLWGAAAWLLLPAPSLLTEAFVLVAMIVVVMGGAGMMSTVRDARLTFIWCSALPMAVGVARFGDAQHLLMGGGFVLLALIVQKNSADQEQAIRQAMSAQLRMAHAVAALAAQQAQTEQARREAEAASHAKTAFLAAAGHDLRQPMHAIVQYSTYVRRRNRDPALQSALDLEAVALESMQALLDAVLEVSKLMMGGVRPECRSCELTELLHSVEAQLRPLAESQGLRLVVDAARGPCWAWSDPVLLHRVLMNLGSNAIRYTPRGQVTLRLRRRAAGWQLSVADSGTGMKADDLERIFEPFVQLSNPSRASSKGLGLGLTIVKQLCGLLQIQLRVRSRWQRGTLFRLLVPHGDAAVLAARQAQAPQVDVLNGVRVLLVDDNPLSLEATAFTIRSFGCEVGVAASSAHALADPTWESVVPDLIISDYRLDGETGLEAVAQLRREFSRRVGDEFDIPALMVSGDTGPDELLQVQQAGMTLLHKPASPEALRAAMSRQLRLLAGLGAP